MVLKMPCPIICCFKETFIYFCVCILLCVGASVHLSTYMKVRGQLVRVGSLLASCWSQGTNLDYQAWRQLPLPAEPFFWTHDMLLWKSPPRLNIVNVTWDVGWETLLKILVAVYGGSS